MKNNEFCNHPTLVASTRLMGALLRYKPSDPALLPFLTMLQTEKLEDHWPFGTVEQLQKIQQALLIPIDSKERDMHWQRLFIGPNHLEAPPWGSVYLDAEQVIFGDSAVALGQFLQTLGIQLDTGMNEPEDHIGLMFWYASGLLEKEQIEALRMLLAEHWLPWSARYFELLQQHAEIPFYLGLAQLAELSLIELAVQLQVTGQQRLIHF